MKLVEFLKQDLVKLNDIKLRLTNANGDIPVMNNMVNCWLNNEIVSVRTEQQVVDGELKIVSCIVTIQDTSEKSVLNEIDYRIKMLAAKMNKREIDMSHASDELYSISRRLTELLDSFYWQENEIEQ